MSEYQDLNMNKYYNPMDENKIFALPTDTVTEHPDAQGNKTLYITRLLPNGSQMNATTKPDRTIICNWHEFYWQELESY
jgi:hypothetical protein